MDYLICPLCKVKNIKKSLIKYKELEWVKCKECGGGWMEPYISELDMDEDSFNNFYSRYMSCKDIFDNIACEKAKWLYSKWEPGFMIVEIGAGLGSVANQLKKMNPGIEYAAIEPSVIFADYLRSNGYIVYSGEPVVDLERALKEADKKVVIYLDNVLEHISNPLDYLIRLEKLSLQGSKILLEVPNEFGIRWKSGLQDCLRGFHKPPTFQGHINLFTKRSLRRVLSNASFRNILITYKPIRSVEQVSYLSQIKNLPFMIKAAIALLKIVPIDYIFGIPYWLRAEAQVGVKGKKSNDQE